MPCSARPSTCSASLTVWGLPEWGSACSTNSPPAVAASFHVRLFDKTSFLPFVYNSSYFLSEAPCGWRVQPAWRVRHPGRGYSLKEEIMAMTLETILIMLLYVAAG